MVFNAPMGEAMTPIDIFMAVPLVIIGIVCVLICLEALYNETVRHGFLGLAKQILYYTWWLWVLFAVIHFITKPAHSATTTLPMSARIINLTGMPLDEAIAFCNERNIVCPELRSQWDEITKVQFSSALNNIEPAGGGNE